METFSALLAICAGNSPIPGEFPTHKGQWRGALMFSLICVWINGWVNNGKTGDFRRSRPLCRHRNVFWIFLNITYIAICVTEILQSGAFSVKQKYPWYISFEVSFDKLAICIWLQSVWLTWIHSSLLSACEHIEAETKWPSFRRRCFQKDFLEWKCMNFD